MRNGAAVVLLACLAGSGCESPNAAPPSAPESRRFADLSGERNHLGVWIGAFCDKRTGNLLYVVSDSNGYRTLALGVSVVPGGCAEGK